jgi:hypothetical protein
VINVWWTGCAKKCASLCSTSLCQIKAMLQGIEVDGFAKNFNFEDEV